MALGSNPGSATDQMGDLVHIINCLQPQYTETITVPTHGVVRTE